MVVDEDSWCCQSMLVIVCIVRKFFAHDNMLPSIRLVALHERTSRLHSDRRWADSCMHFLLSLMSWQCIVTTIVIFCLYQLALCHSVCAGTQFIVCFALHHDPADGECPEGSQSKTSEADYTKLKQHACVEQAVDYFFNSNTVKALPV